MTDYNVASKTVKSVKIDASSSNIPSAFSTAATSLVVTGISRADVLIIQSTCTDRLAINYTAGSVSSAPSAVDLYIAAAPASGFCGMAFDNCQLSSTIYIKSDTGAAISSGVVTISVG